MTERCAHAKSEMTPCVLRDGAMCFAMDGSDQPICVGCGHSPEYLGVPRPADWEQQVAAARAAVQKANREVAMKPKFEVGARVEKWTGKYGGPGVVRGIANDLGQPLRYIVGHKIEGGFGEFYHIYAEGNLRIPKSKAKT